MKTTINRLFAAYDTDCILYGKPELAIYSVINQSIDAMWDNGINRVYNRKGFQFSYDTEDSQ